MMSEWSLREPIPDVRFNVPFLVEHCSPAQVEDLYLQGVIAFNTLDGYYVEKERLRLLALEEEVD